MSLQPCTMFLQVRQLEMERFSLAGSTGGDRATADRLAALDAHLRELQDQQKARLLIPLTSVPTNTAASGMSATHHAVRMCPVFAASMLLETWQMVLLPALAST